MPSKEAEHAIKSLRSESTASSLSVDSLALCIVYILMLGCILAFTDRWCPLPVAAEEMTIMVIILLLPLAFNLGFSRRLSSKPTSVAHDDQKQADTGFETARKASVAKAFAKIDLQDSKKSAWQRVATASYDGSLRIWSCSGECERRLEIDPDVALHSVIFSPDGKYIAAGSCDGTATIWDSKTGARLHNFDGYGGIVSSVAFSPCSTKLLTGSDDHCMQLWNLDASSDEEMPLPQTVFEGHIGAVSSVAFSPCGAFVTSASHDATARVWSVATGACEKVFEGHDAEVLAVAYSPCGNMVATGSQDGTARLWSAGAAWCILVLDGHEAAVRSLAFSPCGNFLCTGSADGSAKVWDVQTGMSKMTFRMPSTGSAVHGVAFSKDGASIATTQDEVARLWYVETGTCYTTLEGHTDIVPSVAIFN